MNPHLGAHLDARGAHFRIWSTTARSVSVRLRHVDGGARLLWPMEPEGDGFFSTFVESASHGTRYQFVLDGERNIGDPYAQYLPEGVEGMAMLWQPSYRFQHEPISRPLAQHVIYELHVGTFTPAGTFTAAIERLPYLVDLGVTAIELMPVAAFTGHRGWGYDGVALFAPHAPYGNPDELRALVDAAHGLGLSVFLDVVYNHFGPRGNYLPACSPDYFRRQSGSAWGDAPDFHHPRMRALVLSNARYWLDDFRFDGLRLDATHAMADESPKHILSELVDCANGFTPKKIIIAEDERNHAQLFDTHRVDGIWADDFHHALHVRTTRENDGYYRAYDGSLASVARTIERGWFYEGQPYAPTGKSRGTRAEHLPASAFVYCLQNHDQIGNRPLGDRLSTSLSTELFSAASALLLFLPMPPLLFMGQEWAAQSPFLYFTDHEDELGRQVTEGRRAEFQAFKGFSDAQLRERIPDPQSAKTFEQSKLRWEELEVPQHAGVHALYKALISLRKSDPVLSSSNRQGLSTELLNDDVLLVRRWVGQDARVLICSFSEHEVTVPGFDAETWRLVFSTRDGESGGRVSGIGAQIYAAPKGKG